MARAKVTEYIRDHKRSIVIGLICFVVLVAIITIPVVLFLQSSSGQVVNEKKPSSFDPSAPYSLNAPPSSYVLKKPLAPPHERVRSPDELDRKKFVKDEERSDAGDESSERLFQPFLHKGVYALDGDERKESDTGKPIYAPRLRFSSDREDKNSKPATDHKRNHLQFFAEKFLREGVAAKAIQEKKKHERKMKRIQAEVSQGRVKPVEDSLYLSKLFKDPDSESSSSGDADDGFDSLAQKQKRSSKIGVNDNELNVPEGSDENAMWRKHRAEEKVNLQAEAATKAIQETKRHERKMKRIQAEASQGRVKPFEDSLYLSRLFEKPDSESSSSGDAGDGFDFLLVKAPQSSVALPMEQKYAKVIEELQLKLSRKNKAPKED